MIDIQFNNIQVDSMSKNAGVFVGQNAIYGWSAHLKGNRNIVSNTPKLLRVSQDINIIDDRDLIDMPVNRDISYKGGVDND